MTTIDETAWNDIRDNIASAAREALKAGPLPVPQLTAILQEQGALDELVALHYNGDATTAGEEGLADWLDNILADIPDLWTTDDDVALSLPDFLQTVTVTHRLTAEEIEKGYLVTTFDISVLAFDLHPDDEMRTRSDVIFDRQAMSEAGEDIWQGPTDWLTEFSAGDVIAVTRSELTIDLAKVDEPSTGMVQTFAKKVTNVLELGLESAEVLLLQTLAAFPQDFAKPQPPFSDILDAAGVNRNEAWISKSGSAMTAPRDEYLFDEMVNRYALDDCCMVAFAEIIDGTKPDTTKPVTKQALTHGLALRAFVDWAIEVGRADVARETLTRTTDEAHTAATAFLDGAIADNALQFADARKSYEAALAIDNTFAPAASALAELTADAGEYETTLTLLRRIDADSRERQFLESQISKHANVGRNDPCVCGSGKKYKTCCLNKPASLTPDARLEWLLIRINRFTTRNVEILRELESASMVAFEDPNTAFRAHGTKLFHFAMFEGGGLQVYSGQRGELLDEVDRKLVGALLDSELGFQDDERTVARVITVDDKSTTVGEPFKVPETHEAAVRELIDNEASMREWIDQFALIIE